MIIITNNTYKTLYREAVTEFINAKYYNNRLSSYDNLEEAVLKSKIQNESLQDVANSFICVSREEIEELYKKLPVDKTLIDLYKKKCEEAEILLEFVSLDLIKFIEVSYLGLEIIKLSESTIKLIILLPNIDIGTYTISKENGPILTVNSVEFRTRTDVSLFIINGLLKLLD